MKETVNFKSQNPKSKHLDSSLPDLLENTPVTTYGKHPSTGVKTLFNGIFICWDKENDACILVPDLSKKVYRKSDKFTVLTGTTVEQLFSNPTTPAVAEGIRKVTSHIPHPAKQLEPAKVFDINKRFRFLAQLVKMVVKGQAVSAIISGGGGLGKTYTVMGQVKAAGLQEIGGVFIDSDDEDTMEDVAYSEGDYKVIKGFSTAKGLYNTLYYNRTKLVIFDDCDSVLQNDVAVNILKGALDSYDKRVITWQSQTIAGSEIPNEFEFEGRVIFISNMHVSKNTSASFIQKYIYRCFNDNSGKIRKN